MQSDGLSEGGKPLGGSQEVRIPGGSRTMPFLSRNSQVHNQYELGEYSPVFPNIAGWKIPPFSIGNTYSKSKDPFSSQPC